MLTPIPTQFFYPLCALSMGLLSTLFESNNKITVHFIDATSGETIGVSEMSPEQLPQTFEVATTLNIQNQEWTVQEAIPAHSDDFVKSKKLTLKLSKVEYVNPKDILFSLPTLSNELPPLVDRPLFTDFELTILDDDWRQNEFLNPSSFPLVDVELEKIKAIWEHHSQPVNENFTAFNQLHVRATIGEPNLRIDFQQLQTLLRTSEKGYLKLNGNDGFVQDAFALRTEFTAYYGILDDKLVTQLAISSFSDDTVREVQEITRAFDLLFVSWYHGDVITSDEE